MALNTGLLRGFPFEPFVLVKAGHALLFDAVTSTIVLAPLQQQRQRQRQQVADDVTGGVPLYRVFNFDDTDKAWDLWPGLSSTCKLSWLREAMAHAYLRRILLWQYFLSGACFRDGMSPFHVLVIPLVPIIDNSTCARGLRPTL